jgi:hypothetical protein
MLSVSPKHPLTKEASERLLEIFTVDGALVFFTKNGYDMTPLIASDIIYTVLNYVKSPSTHMSVTIPLKDEEGVSAVKENLEERLTPRIARELYCKLVERNGVFNYVVNLSSAALQRLTGHASGMLRTVYSGNLVVLRNLKTLKHYSRLPDGDGYFKGVFCTPYKSFAESVAAKLVHDALLREIFSAKSSGLTIHKFAAWDTYAEPTA